MLILKVPETELATSFHEIFDLCRNIKQLFISIYIYLFIIFIDMTHSQLISLHLFVFEHNLFFKLFFFSVFYDKCLCHKFSWVTVFFSAAVDRKYLWIRVRTG